MNQTDAFFHTDCRHFRPHQPCTPHKERGVVCRDCPEYDPVSPRVLILKVGSLGDVLRSTALLPALKEKFPKVDVTWVAAPEARPLFTGNSVIDRALPYGWETYLSLRQETFDLLWSLDVDPAVAAWVPDLRAGEKRGFSYIDGNLRPLDDSARGWLEMSLRDDLKRANRRTYQQWMFDVCGLAWEDRFRPLWHVTAEERAWAAGRRKAWRISANIRILGLNTGAGGRWRQKKWTPAGLAGFLERIRREKNLKVLLLGGPEERRRNRLLARRFPWVVDTGCANPLRQFGALIGLCDIVVTGDTLAMHIAVGLGKRVVVFFGPTSAKEIELYGLGEKVHKDWGCLPCYRVECLRAPNCIEALSPEEVVAATRRQLAALSPAQLH